MGSTALQGLTVLHHRLDSIGIESACKTFVGRFHTLNDGHCHVFLGKLTVDVQHTYRFFLGFLASGVRRVAFLPQELGSTKEQTGTHFPTEYVCPLVAQDRQVAIRINPVLIGVPNDSFRSRTDDELLFQLCGGVYHYAAAIRVVLQTIVRYYGTLFGKAFHVFRFAAEE